MTTRRPKSTSTPAPTPTHVHSPTGACSVCGRTPGIERSYDINDRFLRILFLAVCKTMNLEPVRHGTTSTLYVTTPDAATQDRLQERVTALSTQLDEQLIAFTVDFIRAHCGLDVPVQSRT